MKYENNNGIVHMCRYYIVFCPKYRRKILAGDIEVRFRELVSDICKDLSVDLIKVEVLPDRVYLELRVEPRLGIHRAVKQIKAKTAPVLRSEFKELSTKLPTLWTNTYLVSTSLKGFREASDAFIASEKTSQRG